MCTRYFSPAQMEIDFWWKLDQDEWWIGHEDMIFPRRRGPFIRRALDDAGYRRQGVVGDWGLIPWFAKERVLKYSTSNARSEELSQKASYKQAWAKGQRCIIPASSFDEPNWESGKNVWWEPLERPGYR